MFEWFKIAAFENYANFKGRARRKEYWYFTLVNVLIMMAIFGSAEVFFEGGMDDPNEIFLGIFGVYFLIMLIPTIAVTVRRLHDINKSGWFYLVSFIPYAGGIWMLVLTVTEGTRGTNKYGPDPKRPLNEIDEIGLVETE